MLSPIHSLPVELLSNIFAHTDMPLVISTVNKQWRRIALNTPALWTTLCVTAEMIQAQEDHDLSLYTTGVFNTGHLTTYIHRSRKYPLDILIDARDPDWDFSEPEFVCYSLTPFQY